MNPLFYTVTPFKFKGSYFVVSIPNKPFVERKKNGLRGNIIL
jgi:hypothetical protein